MWYTAHLTLIQTSLIYILLAMSLQVALRSGVFSLAGIGFYGIGGYAAAILANHGQGVVVSLAIPIVGCTVVGYVLSLPLVRLRGLYLGLVTISFDLILNVFATNGGTLTGGAVGLYGVPALVNTPTIVVIVVVVIAGVSQLERRNFGRAYEALRLNEEVAWSMGIDVRRQRNFAFALSAMLGGIAGALNVLTFTTINPGTAGFGLVVLGLTMAVLGGVGTWVGSAVGAIIITWLPDVLGPVGQWRQLIYGAIVVLTAVYAPEGLVGVARQGWRRLRRRQRPGLSAGRPLSDAAAAPTDQIQAATAVGES
jgi:branched-chain amino acid transport system permease protein